MTHQSSRHERFSGIINYNTDYFKRAVVATVAATPIAPVAAPLPWNIVGVLYLGMWLIAIGSSIGAYLLVMLDAALVLSNHWPVFLDRSFAVQGVPPRRVVKAIHRLAVLSMWINPVSNLALSSLIFATRLRPGLMARVMQKAEDRRNAMKSIELKRIRMTAEFTSPVVERVPPVVLEEQPHERSLQHA